MSIDRRPASLGRRAGAYLIDGAIAIVVTLLAAGVFAGVSFATQGGFALVLAVVLTYVIALAWFAFYTWMQGGGGSIGMRMLGLQLVHAADDKPLGFGRALGRNVVWGLACSIVVGYFSTLFDDSPWHRGWHDKAAGAVMTDIAGHGPAVPAPDAGASVASSAASAEGDADAPASGIPPRPPLPVSPPAPPALGVPVPAAPAVSPASAEPADETVIAQARPQTPAGVISFVPGVTGPPPAVAPARPASASPAPPASPAPARAASVPPTAPSVELPPALDETRLSPSRPVVRLAWDHGDRQAVYGRTLFGRNPAAEPGASTSPIRDETLSLSKTHFEITVSADAAWVIDRQSTNGVVIKRGAGRQDAQPGEPVRLRAGDILEFGDRHVMVEVAP